MKAGELARLLQAIQKGSEVDVTLLDRFQSAYRLSSREERHALFTLLVTQLEVRRADIDASLNAVRAEAADDTVRWSELVTELRKSLESPRMRAFRRFLTASAGLKFLLDFRADVLSAQRQDGSHLGPLDEEIAYLFTSWFHQGFLFLQEITQESPYRQIRFLKDHEMVHPMASLEEMGNRLGEDRRCFGLFHRSMPEEPVVFIEVALTRRIPTSIDEVLRPSPLRDTEPPDTAIFYSINNTQNGLAGLGLGRLLIFQVVDAIKRTRPQVGTYATLSPVSGFFSRYLKPILEGFDGGFALKRSRVSSYFSERARRTLLEKSGGGERDFASALGSLLSNSGWIEDPRIRRELASPLTRLGYFYLARERDASGKPLNPVAGFHLGNGARLDRKNVHFGANRAERAIQDACGLMVSYLYSSTWLHQLRRTARSVLPWEA